MELGEWLFFIAQKIIGVVGTEFKSFGLPPNLQPMVMRYVEAHFLENAYDSMIAAKIMEHTSNIDGNSKKEPPQEIPNTDIEESAPMSSEVKEDGSS